MPSPRVPSRPQRQLDYGSIPRDRALVLDNGAFACRVGWAGEADPRFTFRNVLNKPRHRSTGEVVSIVGNYDPDLVKVFDFTRSSLRTPFDANVVYHFDIMETILDYAFERIGVNESQVDHPVLMTECPCNPVYSRGKMAELMFETFGVPSVAFGIDGVFSYKHNQKLGVCEPSGMLVCSAHMATHSIPMVHGEPIIGACCRTSVGGYHVTDYLRQIFCLQHPYHALTSSASVLWENIEGVKQQYCYVAEDYCSELQKFQMGGEKVAEMTKWWQVPWAPAPQSKEKEQVDEEEIARKAAIKEKQGQRLRDMAAAKRAAKQSQLEAELEELERLSEELEGADAAEVEAILEPSGYASKHEIQGRHAKVVASLKKLKGEQVDPQKEQSEVPVSEKYPLLDVPDSELTEEQLKEKKKQKFLKITAEGRARAKQKREEEELQKEYEQQLEEERRRANPEQYLEELRTKHAELGARVQQRKRQRTGSLISSTALTTGAGGRGERLTAVQKERMKLLTTAAFDRGKEEDTFGMKDEDWQLYKRMGKDDAEEIEEDEAEYTRLTSRLKELDPTFVSPDEPIQGLQPALQDAQQRKLTEADYRIPLGVELFRCPEILFQTSMVGVDQAGIGESVALSVRRLPQEFQELVEAGSVFLTGGNSLFPGFVARIHAELQRCRPLGAHIKVVRAADPLLDAWRGASTFAATSSFGSHVFTKADYDERGPGWLRAYQLSYS